MNPLDTEKIEQTKANQLEQYVAGLEQGNIFAVQGEVSPEDQEMLRFARAFKVTNQPIHVRAEMVDQFLPPPKKGWSWMLLFPVLGGAVAVGAFLILRQPSVSTNDQLANANRVNVNLANVLVANVDTSHAVALAEIQDQLAEIDLLEADLTVTSADLDNEIEEINFYAAEDGLENIWNDLPSWFWFLVYLYPWWQVRLLLNQILIRI